MDDHHDCRCYIIPPHVLHHMAAHDDARIRGAARSTLLATRELHAEREISARPTKTPAQRPATQWRASSGPMTGR